MPLAHTYLFTGVRICPAWSPILFLLKTTRIYGVFFKKRVFLRFDTHNNLGILGIAEVLSQKIVVWVFKKCTCLADTW